jgi:DTW domain-containing protein YfiP
LVVIIDGTWAHAKRMKRLSKNLHALPSIAFTPPTPSVFRVRRQPKVECYSTLEAAHHLMVLLGYGDHRGMLDTFEWMVDRHADHMPTLRRR